MEEFKKETHIEISTSDTTIFCDKNCSLTEKETNKEECILDRKTKIGMMGAPCCFCTAYINKVNIQYPFFEKVIMDKDVKSGKTTICNNKKYPK